MTKGTLPPQAYTREMLTQAFQWVQTQPESIRKLADSADALVGLFLRAKRSGDASLEASAPVSTENFRANLKSIAAELQQFSGASGTVTSTQIPEPPKWKSHPIQNDLQILESAPTYEAPKLEPIQIPEYRPPATVSAATLSQPTASSSAGTFSLDSLDPKSRMALQKVQTRFNLSSETEALRLLITLGLERVEKI